MMIRDGYFAIKLRVAEFYQREFLAGRIPNLPEKGKLVNYYAAELEDFADLDCIHLPSIASKSGMIAVINITGVMTRFGEACAYGTEYISQQLQAAYQDTRVSGIVIRFVTPGGEVSGTKALADTIVKRTKPVVAFCSQADSAGYWVASQADEIFLENSADAEVGSIGVYAVHVDQQENMKQQGIKISIIRAKGSDNKVLKNPYEPLTEELIQKEINALTDIRTEFVQMVKKARPNVDDSALTGETYRSNQAIKMGLADKIGTLEDAILRADFLSRKAIRASNTNSNNVNNNQAKEMGGFFSELFAKHSPADASAAEKIADDAVAAKDTAITEAIQRAESAEKSAKEANDKFKEMQEKYQVAQKDADAYAKIKDDHAANSSFVQNLKEVGIAASKDANTATGTPKVRSYQKAPWNEIAMEIANK